jgi:hypothetical protein
MSYPFNQKGSIMARFRFHRGSLSESMETMIHVTDRKHLAEQLSEFMGLAIDPNKLKFTHQCYDSRTGWDTFIVTCDGMIGVIGHVDVDL